MTTHTLKTIELSDCDISSYLNIYNKIFETEKSVGVFKNEYMNTPLGFSYHTFLYNDSCCSIYSWGSSARSGSARNNGKGRWGCGSLWVPPVSA